MTETDIVCPVCGGPLEYWKEYIATKTQTISKTGKISHTVKTSKPQEFNCADMEGFQCTKCGWTVNTVTDFFFGEKYPHLDEWLVAHDDEIKV